MDLSIIIVNYNTRDVLKKCLQNLCNISIDLKYEIIVVDNGSLDGSVEMIKKDFKNVNVFAEKNIGLASGSNVGLRNSKGKYILFLGSDAFPKKGTVEGMLEFFKTTSEVGVGTCELVLRNGVLDLDAHRGFPTPWTAITHFLGLGKVFPKSKIFNQYFLGWEDLDKPHEIDLCISHFMLVKRAVFDQIGFLDEDYFVYGEDVDFCFRAKEAGWKIMYLPQWKTVHYKGASVGVRRESFDITTATRETIIKMNRETTRAMRLFYSKHYKNRYPLFVTFLVILGVDILERIRFYNASEIPRPLARGS